MIDAPVRALDSSGQAGASSRSPVHVFVSFDTEHDADLYALILAQSTAPSSGFTVSGSSSSSLTTNLEGESAQPGIRDADQVIFICGEHTGTSTRVSAELELAQQERIPYFLLWGRRGSMCTKPTGARSAEGMYSWTRQILQHQIAYTSRTSAEDRAADALREADRNR
jgi:hypothetical protein